jgi:hypothetical protein
MLLLISVIVSSNLKLRRVHEEASSPLLNCMHGEILAAITSRNHKYIRGMKNKIQCAVLCFFFVNKSLNLVQKQCVLR